MDRRPTIIDVAARAGVSKSTVSLVLQHSPQVRAETRETVLRAMAEIGYVYNRAAATLRSANAGLIGLVINDLRNPFFTEFATSAQMALSARGYATVIANTDEDPAVQAQVVGAMIEHGVSALVISPVYGGEGDTFDRIARAGIPTLQVLRRVANPQLFPFAAPDYETGSRLATEHLLSLGVQRVAFVGGIEGRAVVRERMAGYLAALAQRGTAPLVLYGRPGRGYGNEAAQVLMRAYPAIDGVVCFNDLVALGLLTGCARIGRQVGRDVRVVGFDDIEECAQAWPTLSSVRCGIDEFGRRMAQTILDWLEAGCRPEAVVRTPVELVRRGSSLG